MQAYDNTGIYLFIFVLFLFVTGVH